MRLDRFVTLRLMPRGPVASTARAVPVLMYHSISDDPEPGVGGYYRTCTSPAVFREQMHALRAHGLRAVSLPDVQRALAADAPAGSAIVAVTFDDGYRDVLTAAWPVLEALGFTATVFLPTAYIGDTPLPFLGRPCLSWGEVRELHRAGLHFGSHTVNHPVLWKLPGAAVHAELRDSKRVLEDRLGAEVTTFAHPYAFPQEDPDYVQRFEAMLGSEGYRCAVTTRIGRVRPGDPCYTWKRLPVNALDDAPLFAAKLAGAYDWLGPFQSATRRVKRALRRLRPGRRPAGASSQPVHNSHP